MLIHYFLITIRNLKRKILYTIIVVFGLSIGLAIALMVLGYINFESSFEDIHKNKHRIYRLNTRVKLEEGERYSARTITPLVRSMYGQLPEIEELAFFTVLGKLDLEIEGSSFKSLGNYRHQGYAHSGNVFAANPGFLDVFTLPLKVGDPGKVLSEPHQVLITERAADKYFRDLNPLGRTIRFADEMECTVTGVLRDIPDNTQIKFDFLISISTLNDQAMIPDWSKIGAGYAYLLLETGADPDLLLPKISSIFSANVPNSAAENFNFELQPLSEIYFDIYGSGREYDLYPAGEKSMIYPMIILGVFILLLAIVNFINLSTARIMDRLKEVGIRKIFGSLRSQLVRRFLLESLLLSLISIFLSIVIYEITIYEINSILPRQMFANLDHNLIMISAIFGLVILVGLVAGIYPALYFSRIQPLSLIRTWSDLRSSRSTFRRILVVFQFSIAITFITTSIILHQQFNMLLKKDLRFDQENIMIIEIEGEKSARDCRILKKEVEKIPGIKSVTASRGLPGIRGAGYYELHLDPDKKEEKGFISRMFFIDQDYFTTFDIDLLDGRMVSENVPGDQGRAVIINKEALQDLGLSDPIGFKLYGNNERVFEIVGVAEEILASPLNHHYRSTLCYMVDQDKFNTLSLKLAQKGNEKVIKKVAETWDRLFPERHFKYSFLDQEIRANYNDIKAQKGLFLVLAVLTFVIAALGVYALVSYSSEQKTKEIGIRKVFGASIRNIIDHLCLEYVKLILLANLISFPLAFMLSRVFLSSYPFRISISPGIFIITALCTFGLVFLVTGLKTYRTARGNPIEALRYE